MSRFGNILALAAGLVVQLSATALQAAEPADVGMPRAVTIGAPLSTLMIFTVIAVLALAIAALLFFCVPELHARLEPLS